MILRIAIHKGFNHRNFGSLNKITTVLGGRPNKLAVVLVLEKSTPIPSQKYFTSSLHTSKLSESTHRTRIIYLIKLKVTLR